MPTVTVTEKRLIVVAERPIPRREWVQIVKDLGLELRTLRLDDYRMDDFGTANPVETWWFSLEPVDTKVPVQI